MKRYNFDIATWEDDLYFSPIREKRDVVVILMRVLKLINAPVAIDPSNKAGEIVLTVGKMSRLFVVGNSKIYTIRFPFAIRESQDRLIVSTLSIDDIDSKMTPEIIALFSDTQVFESHDLSDFFATVEELLIASSNLWPLIREMLMFEDGYLRFDDDPENVKGKLHPLYHYDFFYTQACSLKIGVNERHGLKEVINLLNRSTDCLFLS